jgi:hypothetical protein
VVVALDPDHVAAPGASEPEVAVAMTAAVEPVQAAEPGVNVPATAPAATVPVDPAQVTAPGPKVPGVATAVMEAGDPAQPRSPWNAPEAPAAVSDPVDPVHAASPGTYAPLVAAAAKFPIDPVQVTTSGVKASLVAATVKVPVEAVHVASPEVNVPGEDAATAEPVEPDHVEGAAPPEITAAIIVLEFADSPDTSAVVEVDPVRYPTASSEVGVEPVESISSVYVAPGVEPLVSLREPRTYTVRSSAVGVVAVVTLRLVAVEWTTETAPERVAPPAMWTTARRAAAGAAGRVTVTVPDPGEAGTVAQNRWTASLLAVAGAAVTTCQDHDPASVIESADVVTAPVAAELPDADMATSSRPAVGRCASSSADT